jgi:formate dehydrogenase major subunit
MAISRREFLKISVVATTGILMGSVFDLKPIEAYAQANPPVWTSEAISICGYCSVGCSMIVGSQLIGGKPYVTYVQGNPDSPINKGSLCSKGTASVQFSTIVSSDSGVSVPNPARLIAVKHRAPYATVWDTEYMTMDQAISLIASKAQATRDETFVETEIKPEGVLTVNRCEGIASLGAAAFNNESCYLITKLMRALGIVYLEHQARV